MGFRLLPGLAAPRVGAGHVKERRRVLRVDAQDPFILGDGHLLDDGRER